jgi:hypothetical protein
MIPLLGFSRVFSNEGKSIAYENLEIFRRALNPCKNIFNVSPKMFYNWLVK